MLKTAVQQTNFWQERDYNAVPLECRFISQSLCKCDCSLSQESTEEKLHILNASFSFCNRSQAYFLLFLGQRDQRKVSQRNYYNITCSKSVFQNLPNCRSVILKEYVKSAILSTTPRICQHEHDTRIWYHGMAASKACLQDPVLAFFPHCRAWSQAKN